MKSIHKCNYITESVSNIDCLKPYLADISENGNYGEYPKRMPTNAMKEVEFIRTNRFLQPDRPDSCQTQASEVIGDRKLTWMHIEKLSEYGVYFNIIALWGVDLFMVLGRSDWNLKFYRYDFDFTTGLPLRLPVEPLKKVPIENVWVPHECPHCKRLDWMVNIHSLVYAGNPQCPDCDDSMEPVSGEAEIEDMNERHQRMRGEKP